VCACLIGFTVWKIIDSRARTLAQNAIDSANLAQSLAQHASRTFEAVDLVLLDVVERVEHDNPSAEQLARLRRVLVMDIENVHQIRELAVYDAAGNWIASSLPSLPTYSNADRSYFIFHREHSDAGLHIEPPLKSRDNGRWTILLSRRISGSDGSFLGIALAAIDLDYFQLFYDRIAIGNLGTITLFRVDGKILVRRPLEDTMVGRDLSRLPLFRDYLPKAEAGNYQTISAIDGVQRRAAYRRLPDYPLVVVVAQAEGEILASWRVDTRLSLLTIGAVTGVIGLLATFAVVQLCRNDRAAEENLKLTRQARETERRARDELAEMAVTDPLTGLENRRGLQENLTLELASAIRTNNPLALIMIDVDKFKTYNDTYGHIAGDKCLQKVASVLQRVGRRPRDRRYRFGGEEFLLLLPETHQEGAAVLAEKIRADVEGLVIEHSGSEFGVITVSSGMIVAACSSSALSDPEMLLKHVDAALYQAKAQGRNRVVAGDFLPRAGSSGATRQIPTASTDIADR
jgi:diguanylate cyclase (GGDEF)-like protein